MDLLVGQSLLFVNYLTLSAVLRTDMPATITQNEFMRRMKDMESVGGGGMMMGMGGMPDMYDLLVNANNPLVGKLLVETDEKKQDQLIKQTE